METPESNCIKDLACEWNGFTFRLALPSDCEIILENLREHYYSNDDPLSQISRFYENRADTDQERIREILPQKLSILAIHKESNQIAGVRLIYESNKNEFSSSPITYIHLGNGPQQKFLTELEDKCNVFEIFGISRCAELYISSVSKNYRDMGLATQMYKIALEFLKNQNFEIAKGLFAGEVTRHIANKLGFHELGRKYFCEFMYENDGREIIKNTNGNQFVALMAYRFK